jgi:hypothetical protein
MWQDAVRLQPAIGRQQLAEIAIAIGDMVSAGALRIARRQSGDMDQREAVVLVVIGQEAQPLVAEHDAGGEHGLVPLRHLVELAGAQYEMGEFCRVDRLGRRGEPADRGNIVHRRVSRRAYKLALSLHRGGHYRETPS